MSKASQQQTPYADNPPANLAVSVILIRDSAGGLEAFVQHRASTMDFAAGAVAFPGGRVDSIDSSGWYFDHEILADHAAAWAASKISEPPSLSLLNVGRLMAAARREVEEECGISLDQSALKPWANWITPEGLPKRFDTYFYVSAVTAGVEPIHQTTEASASLWIPVVELLEKQEAGLLKVLPPTLSVLDELDELGTVARVLELKRSIVPVRLRSDGIEEFYALRRQRRLMSGHM
ncbi:8-oxo-dGTP pyrophosphatase MutT (NUDIX family) [Arthrobacter ulcerisalmonis]|nr:NUDIX hydrolase [Arthrobacter ulcerisalmonis]MDQ0664611.1 8-oxo-dGTP pyrophosphatase MutT (NUDIX family) [Arthrobacter ulcerisalmonis]